MENNQSTRICALNGCCNEFEHNNTTRKYCSNDCKLKAQYARKNKQYQDKEKTKRICDFCGKEYIITRKDNRYCSDKCRKECRLSKNNDKKYTHSIICATCNNQKDNVPKNTKYCSYECSRIATLKRQEEQRKPLKKILEARICPHCQKEFIPTRSNQKYCSSECTNNFNNKVVHQRQKDKKPIPMIVCKNCLKEVRKRNGMVFCCKECKEEYNKKTKPVIFKEYSKLCIICGNPYITNKPYIVVCSDECRKKRIRVQRKETKHRRKAKILNNEYEKIDYNIVRERCGDKCYVCHKKINFNLPFPHDMSASIEHIYPISLGGQENYSNVTYSHLSCNREKWNKIPESGLQQYLNFA